MAQVSSLEIIRQTKGAVGAFNVILVEHAEALAEAAEIAQSGTILQISENCVKYHGSLKAIGLQQKQSLKAHHNLYLYILTMQKVLTSSKKR